MGKVHFTLLKLFATSPTYLKVMTALLMGQPMTKEVAVSRVTSDTSEMQVESHTSDRGTCTGELAGKEARKQVFFS